LDRDGCCQNSASKHKLSHLWLPIHKRLLGFVGTGMVIVPAGAAVVKDLAAERRPNEKDGRG
jgi:hypothetical protein